jgi:hypothetical protein
MGGICYRIGRAGLKNTFRRGLLNHTRWIQVIKLVIIIGPLLQTVQSGQFVRHVHPDVIAFSFVYHKRIFNITDVICNRIVCCISPVTLEIVHNIGYRD